MNYLTPNTYETYNSYTNKLLFYVFEFVFSGTQDFGTG